MLNSHRFKLGPKRKDSNAFQRLHNLHSSHQTQNIQQAKDISSRNPLQGHQNSQISNLTNFSCQPFSQSSKINSIASNIAKLSQNAVLSEIANSRPFSQNEQMNYKYKCVVEQLQTQQKQIQTHTQNNSLMQRNICQMTQASLMKDQLVRDLESKIKCLESQNNELSHFIKSFDKVHYETEINRFRDQCIKLQITNFQQSQQLEHYNLKINQIQRQLISKNQQHKNLQKSFEKEKKGLFSTQSKSNQNEVFFKRAFQQSQAQNQILCRALQEMTRQFEAEEKLRKQKQKSIQGMQTQIQTLIDRAKQSEMKHTQSLKLYEIQMKEQIQKMLNVQKQQQAKIKESEIKINQLTLDLSSSLDAKRRTQVQLRLSNQSQQNQFKLNSQRTILRYQQEIRQFQETITANQKLISDLHCKLKQYYSPEQYMGLERRCKELQEKRLSSARYYQQKLYNYQKQNDKLRIQKTNIVPEQAKQQVTFDQVIKKTIEESQCLRAELTRMSESLNAAKEEAAQLRQKQKNYLNELEIMRKKNESNNKNFQIQLEVERQKLVNEVQSLARKLSTLQARLDSKIADNKQKDDFIKNYLINRSQPLQKLTVLAEFERILKENDSSTKIQAA